MKLHRRVQQTHPGFRLLKTSALVIGSLLFGLPGLAFAALHQYNIPAQSLNNALVKFAADSNLALIFSADTVRGLNAERLEGQMMPEQALTRLLKGTGYSYRFIDAATITLIPRQESENKPKEQDIAVMETTIVSDRVGDTATDVWSDVVMDDPKSYQAIAANSATRTDTPIKQIPQSIQAIKRSLIDDQQNITLNEALYNVSGVVPRNVLFTPVVEGTLIRGFRAEQLIDGFTQYYNAGDRESLVNIDRVEVLKGANAVFYSGGSGSPVGGVISVISKLPETKPFGEFGFRAGSFDYYQPYLDVNQPINDNVLFRMTAEYTNSASQIDHINTQRFNVNPTLVLTNNGDTTLTLQGKLSHWQQPEYQGLPATGTLAGDFTISPHTFIGIADMPDSRSDSQAVWATLAHRIDDIWSMNIRGRYADSEFSEKTQTLFNGTSFIADTPLIAPSTWAMVNSELFQQQQEVSFQGYAEAKFNYAISKNIFLFGADYSQLQDDGYVNVANQIAGLVDLANPSFVNAYQIPGPAINNQSVTNATYGGYLQLQSHIGERLHTLLSLRLGGVEIAYDNRLSDISSKTEQLKLLPKMGAVYDLTDEVSVFAAYSEGMRGQPFVNFAAASTPELSRQFEAGLKLDFSGQLSGQIAAYQIDREQVAVATSDNSSLYIANGRQRSKGVEVDLLWQPLYQLSVLGSYAHTDAKFADEESGVPLGNRLPWVPENSGRVWANYRFNHEMLEGLNVGFGVYLRSGAFLGNQNAYKTDGYHSFDAVVSYEIGAIKLAATVKNLSNEAYFQPFQYYGSGTSGGGRVAPGLERMLFVSTSVKF